MELETTCIRKTNGEAEAQHVKAFLEANGIPAYLRGEAVRLTHGFTLDGLGVIEIHVPAEQAASAQALLADADAGRLRIDESASDELDSRPIEPN